MKSFITTLIICFCSAAFASNQGAAVYSPSCNAKQIKAIAGESIVSISERQTWANKLQGYTIVLDTKKMTYQKLTQQMQKKGCFKP